MAGFPSLTSTSTYTSVTYLFYFTYYKRVLYRTHPYTHVYTYFVYIGPAGLSVNRSTLIPPYRDSRICTRKSCNFMYSISFLLRFLSQLNLVKLADRQTRQLSLYLSCYMAGILTSHSLIDQIELFYSRK